MKILGTLFSTNIYIDTDDEELYEMAQRYLENLKKRDEKLTEVETSNELKLFL